MPYVRVAPYLWIVDFPENRQHRFHFLSAEDQALAKSRIAKDRGDYEADPFSGQKCLSNALCRPKGLFILRPLLLPQPPCPTSCRSFCNQVWAFLKTIVSFFQLLSISNLSYQSSSPSIVRDLCQLRGVVLTFHCLCTIIGFCMLGFASQVTVRYVGTWLANGAYVSNWVSAPQSLRESIPTSDTFRVYHFLSVARGQTSIRSFPQPRTIYALTMRSASGHERILSNQCNNTNGRERPSQHPSLLVTDLVALHVALL